MFQASHGTDPAIQPQRSLKRIVVVPDPPVAEGRKRQLRTAETVTPLKTPGGLALRTETPVTDPDGDTV